MSSSVVDAPTTVYREFCYSSFIFVEFTHNTLSFDSRVTICSQPPLMKLP